MVILANLFHVLAKLFFMLLDGTSVKTALQLLIQFLDCMIMCGNLVRLNLIAGARGTLRGKTMDRRFPIAIVDTIGLILLSIYPIRSSSYYAINPASSFVIS